MDDNLTLSDEVRERYSKMYSGVFRDRYIEGRHTCPAYTERYLKNKVI